jgi:uncharacterized membrane protein
VDSVAAAVVLEAVAPRAGGNVLTKFENDELVHAITSAEKGSRGELRVLILRKCKGDALEEAKTQFALHEMEKTEGRTGVLLLYCPADHKIAIYGDTGIHAVVGDRFWKDVIAQALVPARRGEDLLALLTAVQAIGRVFHKHFSAEGNGVGNELPNAPIYGD